MKIKNKKLEIIIAVALCISVIFSVISFSSSAENVVVEEVNNPELKFEIIHGIDNDKKNTWEPKGSLIQDPEKGSYTINTNAFAPWFTKDTVCFAYKEMPFEYGSSGTLILETQLDKFTATASPNAGAGIMLRTSLEPGASNVILHVRPNMIMVQYRAVENNGSIRGKTVDSAATYPVKMKIVLNKGKAVCYLQQGGAKEYAQFASIPFVAGDKVYAGLASWSQYEAEFSDAIYSGFNCQVLAPEGMEPVTSEGSTSSDTSSEEEEVKLPEDAPAAGDVLMRETFTDGILTSGTSKYPDSPVWKKKSTYTPQLITNADNTNRYLYDWMESKVYYFAGDQSWTDYTLSTDLRFTKEFSDEAENELYIYFRNTDIMQYGVHNYGVGFKNGRIFLVRRTGGTFDVVPTEITELDSAGKTIYYDYEYNYLNSNENEGPVSIGVNHNLKVKVIDNVITVFWDGKQIIQYTDTTPTVIGKGAIGFMVNNAAVEIDNIVVTEEVDLIGGDYDNYICGNWNEPVPELIREYDKNGWDYGSVEIPKGEE